MSRKGGRPIPPRLPPDRSSEPSLNLATRSEINGLTVQGDFSDGLLGELVIEDSLIARSSFIAADLNRLRLVDVQVEECDFSGADMEGAAFTRVTFKGCRMSGALIPRAQMQDVACSEVRLDDVNFRMSRGDRVLFDHVDLRRSEFYSPHI